jgi:hypothetical protein
MTHHVKIYAKNIAVSDVDSRDDHKLRVRRCSIDTPTAQRLSVLSPLELVTLSPAASNMFESTEKAKSWIEKCGDHGQETFPWRFGGIPFQRKEVCDVVGQEEAGDSHEARRFTY